MKIFSLVALTLLAQVALAHGPGRDIRYRVEEVQPPASLMQGCRDDLRVFSGGVGINDFGLVAGNFSCWYQSGPGPNDISTKGGPFNWASAFGSVELMGTGDPTLSSFSSTVNNRGETFGLQFQPTGFIGVRWTLGGGFERVFEEPACEFLNLSSAVAGNGRYVVGWGFRTDATQGPPFDTLCLQSRWLTKTASGIEIPGPVGAEPRDLNALSVAVGRQGSNAIRYNVANGELRVLHAGDETHQALAYDINDLGEVAGNISLGPQFDTCSPALAVRWERNGRETILPNLPGATSSRAWAVGYDNETLGESGPGQYCEPENSNNEHAVIWRGNRVTDLNDQIAPWLRVTLAAAVGTNRRGQILIYGFRDDDPLRSCPASIFDPVTGQTTIDFSHQCRYQRIFVLTPLGR